MKVKRFRILRLRHHISMVELGKACGVSPQRISELELTDHTPEAATVCKIQRGFDRVIAQREEKLNNLRQEYTQCRDELMEKVGEYEYEI